MDQSGSIASVAGPSNQPELILEDYAVDFPRFDANVQVDKRNKRNKYKFFNFRFCFIVFSLLHLFFIFLNRYVIKPKITSRFFPKQMITRQTAKLQRRFNLKECFVQIKRNPHLESLIMLNEPRKICERRHTENPSKIDNLVDHAEEREGFHLATIDEFDPVAINGFGDLNEGDLVYNHESSDDEEQNQQQPQQQSNKRPVPDLISIRQVQNPEMALLSFVRAQAEKLNARDLARR